MFGNFRDAPHANSVYVYLHQTEDNLIDFHLYKKPLVCELPFAI